MSQFENAEGLEGIMGYSVEEAPSGERSLPALIEALLFVSAEPVNALCLAEHAHVSLAELMHALHSLEQRYAQQGSGLELKECAGGWSLRTKSLYFDELSEYVLSWDTRKLSQAALETLAIIAYGQPITRQSVAQIRGVSSDSPINSLLDKGLIKELGQADSPGNPSLYGTSLAFLEKFGLSSVKQLPPLELFAPDDQTRMRIAERLGVVSESDFIAQANFEPSKDSFDREVTTFCQEPQASHKQALAMQTQEPSAQISFQDEAPVDNEVLGFASQMQVHRDISDTPSAVEGIGESFNEVMQQALGKSFGVVEKIDFSKITLEDDDFDLDIKG